MAKKNFSDIEPVHQFISGLDKIAEPAKEEAGEPQQETPAEPAAAVSAAPIGYKLNPKFIEIKSKRLQLVLQPSLFRKVKRAALQNHQSVNDYIHKILEHHTKEV